MNSTGTIALNILVAVVVLVLLLWRQLRERPVKEQSPYRLMIILGIIGAFELLQYGSAHDVSATAYLILVVSLVIGGGFGALRGLTVHLWRDEGVLVQKGNWITLVLWLIGIGLHLGIDRIHMIGDQSTSLGSVSVLLYIALTLGAQRLIVLKRAETALQKEEFHARRAEKRAKNNDN